MKNSGRILPALFPLFLLGLYLVFPSKHPAVAPDSEAVSGKPEIVQPISKNLGKSSVKSRQKDDDKSQPEVFPDHRELTEALLQGVPLRVSLNDELGKIAKLDLLVRPMRVLGDRFQVSLGSNFENTLPANIATYEGWSFIPNGTRFGRTTVAMVNGAFSAVLREEDGSIIELKTDPKSGDILALRLGPDSLAAHCDDKVLNDERVATMSSSAAPIEDSDWVPVTIAPQWGTDPATGEITKYEQPIPNGSLYDLSLPDATVMVVLAKDATGSDSATNLASKTSTYLARMANTATIWENQLGIRLLVSELILTPNTNAYVDVGESLSDFRSWGNTNRPRNDYPRSIAARFGNQGFSGAVIGLAYVGVVDSGSGYSINKTNFNFTLVAHEMGHNFGSGHSSGGVMNGGYIGGQRDFYRDVSEGETAAKDIYDHSKSRLFGPATLRHAEEFAFAQDDSLTTPADTPLLFTPLTNDDASVRNGATNNLTIAEVSRVYPPGAGSAELAGDTGVLFTPSSGFQGYAWLSYSLQGDVGNNGNGWLHRGDVAILVGADRSSNTNLVLAAGESVIFDPPGSGSASIETQATQSRVDVTRDDNGLLVIRTDASASGNDSFVVRRNSTNYTININYVSRPPTTAGDVVIADPAGGAVRFNPMSNDDGVGYRRPIQMGARIGAAGTSTDYFPNAFRLVSATNLDPSKGSLSLETIEIVANGTSAQRPTGFMSFNPIANATGVADIDYVVEDAAGNQVTETTTIILSLLELISPASSSINIPANVGLTIEGNTHSSSAGALSGVVAVAWETLSAPVGGVATFADPTSLSTTVQFNLPGTYVLRAIGTDSGVSSEQQLTVQVTANAGGQNLAPTVSLTDSTVAVSSGGPFNLAVASPTATDDGLPSPPATTALNWTQVSGPGPVGFDDSSILAPDATFPYPGIYQLRLTADDGEVQTFDEVTINYTGPGNGVPITTGIANVHVSENAPNRIIDLFPAFEDLEDADNALTYSLTDNSNPALFSSATIAGDPEELTLQFVPTASGVSSLTVRATDTVSNFVETTFLVTVSNSAPVINPIAHQNLAEGQTLNLNVSASDPDNHGLTYSLVPGAPNGMTIDSNSGGLSWATDEDDGPATYPVVVRVIDDSSLALSTTAFFTVTVTEVNEAPLISPIADVTNFAQTNFLQVVTVNDPDLPANDITLTLETAPTGAIVHQQSRTILWAPPAAGTYNFTVRADDQGSPNLSDTESFSVQVTNAAPTIADQSFTVPENSIPGTEVGTVGASDGDGDDVTFAITGGNTSSAFSIDPNSGLITVNNSGPLDFEDNNPMTITVTTTDDAIPALSRPATITINFSNVNEAPTIADQNIELEVGSLFGATIGTVSASDPENDPLTFSIVSGNDNGLFAIDPQSGTLTVAGQGTLSNNPALTIAVSDNGAPALSDSGVVTLILKQVLVADPADARVLVPNAGSPATTWRNRTFDDSSWTTGQTGVGYERSSGYESLLQTDVEAEMYDTNESVWIRIPFSVSNPASISNLTLRMKYDDGFAAYLNGQRIEARNAGAEPLAWNEGATGGHDDDDAVDFQTYDVSGSVGTLVAGQNILAIHGLNNGTGSSDMLIVPELTTTGGGPIGQPNLPTIGLATPQSIASTSALISTDLTFTGGEDPEVFAVWGTSDGGATLGQWTNSQSIGIQGEGTISASLSGLTANTQYFIRFYAVNSAGTAWSPQSNNFTTSATPEITNTLIATGATARYLVPTNDSEGTAWRNFGYNDSGWSTGATGIGYERDSGYESLLMTDVEAAMYDENETIYLRFPFTLVDPGSLTALRLRVKYDDAYVAFINGSEATRTTNAPSQLSWNAGATSGHSDSSAVEFQQVNILSAISGDLQIGDNILAIHGMNRSTTSSDLLFIPELIAVASETSYLAWLATHPQLLGDDQLIDSDPDHDNRENFLEYAYGLNPTGTDAPTVADHPVDPEFNAVDDSGDAIEVTFRRRIDYQAHGLTYTIESTDDLINPNWAEVAATLVGNPVPAGDGIAEIVTLRLTAAPVAPEFYRMAVSRN